MDDCRAVISIPVRAAANIPSVACGSISNFTPAYSPLRHHLEGTATCGKKQSHLQRNGLRLLPGVPRQARCVPVQDRKSTRLNSSHRTISYAVFCLKKKNPSCQTGATS